MFSVACNAEYKAAGERPVTFVTVGAFSLLLTGLCGTGTLACANASFSRKQAPAREPPPRAQAPQQAQNRRSPGTPLKTAHAGDPGAGATHHTQPVLLGVSQLSLQTTQVGDHDRLRIHADQIF